MTVHPEILVGYAVAHDQGGLVLPAAALSDGYALLFERDVDNPFVTTPVRGEDWRQPGHRFAGLLWAHVVALEPMAGGQRWWKPPVFPIAIHCKFPVGDSIVITILSDAVLVMRPQRLHRQTGHRSP